MIKIMKVVGLTLAFLFPVIFYFVSLSTDNPRYFFYAIAASFSGFITFGILRVMYRRSQ
jgi:hypothetical protein